MENQLSPEAINAIKKAREAEAKLKSLGATQVIGETPMTNPSNQSPLPTEPQVKPQQVKVNTGNLEEVKEYDTFVELTNLPSKGKFYREPLKAQPMKVPDLILIQGIDDDNMTSRFTDIFARRIRGVSPLDILLIDEYYISLWMRNATFPTYFFPHEGYTCNKCAFKVSSDMAEFGFDQIEVKTNLDTLIDAFGEKGFVEVELPISKQIVKIHPRRRIHLARTEKILKDNYHSKNIEPPNGTAELLHLISSIEIGPVSDLRKIFTYIQSDDFDPIDYVELIKICVKYILTDEIVVNFRCVDPNCKEVTSISGYPFRQEIYVPIDENRRSETSKD